MSSKGRISRNALEDMFRQIRATTRWNMDGEMLWGYFFNDTRQDRLRAAQRELEALGYRFVDLWEPEDEAVIDGPFTLHVERIERHTIDSLDARNAELSAFAAKHGLDSYDGMDVGPVATRTQPAATPPPMDA